MERFYRRDNMDFVEIVFKAVDLPLVIGIVVIIQMLKKLVKINTKWWTVILIALGFLAAWLKTDLEIGHIKEFIIQGIVYTSAAEFSYQSWRTVKDSLHKEKK